MDIIIDVNSGKFVRKYSNVILELVGCARNAVSLDLLAYVEYMLLESYFHRQSEQKYLASDSGTTSQC